MADIRGFRGVRYNFEDVCCDPEELLAPPYDVITGDILEKLYDEHPRNVVRLILNRAQDRDTGENNRYTRARRNLFDWLAEGVLTVDDEPGLYVHYQNFDDDQGREYTRRGFLGVVRLSDYEENVVLPHERTLNGPKEDRLELMKSVDANLSPVFLLYDDPDGEVDDLLADQIDVDEPLVDIATEPNDVRGRLWPVFDEETEAKLNEIFQDKKLLIADGHHRYETALDYRDFRRRVAEEPVNEDAPYEFMMAYFVNMRDPGLQIFPTHRILRGLEDFDAHRLRAMLQDSSFFQIESLSDRMTDQPDTLADHLRDAGDEHPSFMMLGQELEQPLLVRFVGELGASFFDDDTGEQVRKLDTTILHEAIFDNMLGIDKEAQAENDFLQYTRDLDEAIGAAGSGEGQLVVLMNPTPIEHVIDVCTAGEKMPQKSTYFYPKVMSGLAINLL
jgi:uncharacterized protein (DUF1015 family)